MKKYIKIFVFLLLLVTITGCDNIFNSKPKVEKMVNVIERTNDAISSYINGNISCSELSKKLEDISDYCSSFEDEAKQILKDDELNASRVGTLCSKVFSMSYDASRDAIKDKYGMKKEYDYSYWEEKRNSINEYLKYFK